MILKVVPSTRVASLAKSIWSEFTALANQHQAVNLGQGFPDISPAPLVKAAYMESVDPEYQQYSHTLGLPRLRKALSLTYSSLLKRDLNPDTELVVTTGATEGLISSMQAIVHPEDEVIVIEPFYDLYSTSVSFPYGKPIFVSMEPNLSHDWLLNMEKLESSITRKCKAILINSPHNPTGKVFSWEELESIARIAKKHNLIVISDEVYERLVYDNVEFPRISTLPGMFDRTLTIGSAGKSFSVTGWRVGWVAGPASIIRYVAAAHARLTFCSPTPLQNAVALCFERAISENYFEKQALLMSRKRDRVLSFLDNLGLVYTKPQGGYFVVIHTDKIQMPLEYKSPVSCNFPSRKDFLLSLWLLEKIKVAAIPMSVFFSDVHSSEGISYLRLCFCKNDETLGHAEEALKKLATHIK